jgi:hypothetical protein
MLADKASVTPGRTPMKAVERETGCIWSHILSEAHPIEHKPALGQQT